MEIYTSWGTDKDVPRARELGLIHCLSQLYPSILKYWVERAWHSMSLLASTCTDALVLMLCQMEYNSTVDPRQYWKLSTFLADLTNADSYPDSDAMKLYNGAFEDPNHPNHSIAKQLDLYRRSITHLLNTAAAQLTTLFRDYPRYTRLALVRRLESRFIDWQSVDMKRLAVLENMGLREEMKPVVVHHAKESKTKVPKEKATGEELAKQLKEKQRKKALAKRKQQVKRNMQASESNGVLGAVDNSNLSIFPHASNDNNDELSNNLAIPDHTLSEIQETPVEVGQCNGLPSSSTRTLHPNTLPPPEGSGPDIELEVLRDGTNSCGRPGGTSIPRSSLASIWTSNDQSASTLNTSPEPSVKDGPRSKDMAALLGTPTQPVKAPGKELSEYMLLTKPGRGAAATSREEEMCAHITRVARRERGSEVASQIAMLLPKPQALPAPVKHKEEEPDKNGRDRQISTVPPKTTKEKRKARTEGNQTESQEARDFDFASHLLYSVPKPEDTPSTSVPEQPVNMDAALTEGDDMDCEFDTMPNAPVRGRHFNKTR